MQKQIPTDFQVLDAIYERYYDIYTAFKPGNRSSKIYVPIDIPQLAIVLKTDVDIVFGRLYYHLQERYGYERADGTKVAFFTPVANDDRDCVHFPLLGSILAGLREDEDKHRTSRWLSIAALIVSVVSLFVSFAI